MGIGKTERPGTNDSLFSKGRRINNTNDRILRNIRVKGGNIRRIGDKWELSVQALDGSDPVVIPDIEVDLTEDENPVGTTEDVIVTAEVDEANKHKINLTYKTVNVLPDGDDPNVALKWDNGATPPAWEKALPVHGENDDSDSAALAYGDRVITGAKTGPNGSLIQLVTKPLPAAYTADPALWNGRKEQNGDLSVYVGLPGAIVATNWQGDSPYYMAGAQQPSDGWLNMGSHAAGFLYAVLSFWNNTNTVSLSWSAGAVADCKYTRAIGYWTGTAWIRLFSSQLTQPLLMDTFSKTNSNTAQMSATDVHQSLDTREILGGSGSTLVVAQLHKFHDPDDHQLLDGNDASFTSTVRGKQLMALRLEDENGSSELKFAKFNPTPTGDSTNVATKWNNTKEAHEKALPIAASDDEQSGDLTTGSRVVTGAKTGPTGALIQLITKPLGSMGGSLPAGDTTNCALKYQSTGWIKVLPVHGTNDAQSGDLTTGSRVVTGLKTAPDGSLIQLITKPLGTMGGLQVGNMTQITVVTAMQYDFTNHKIQCKTRTAYVYSPGTESGWTDVVAFTGFAD